MKRFAAFLISLILINSTFFAVEWPQEEFNKDAVSSYFGQNVNGSISTSLIFKDPAEVKAINDAKILIILDEEEDSSFFPSTLGNAVILCHDDDLISVYANLDNETVNENIGTKTSVKEGEKIGETGNSGWQKTRSNLEFQIIDLQKSAAINPKILLPRTENEIEYSITGVMLQNKEGKFFDIKESKVFPSGSYKVFQTRNKIAVPYKTTITINGVLLDGIAFDTVNQENGKLYVTGEKDKYTVEDLYPNDTLILLGTIMLTPGRSTLGITTLDFLGKTKQQNYILSIY
ncbi:MAG: M23 family metallopeptidase [Treponema sp.]|nr:M23 family metallopeptidase [Treponema sp.]MBR4791139.1 M23 family metallopeptidase [Treponema sp.]